MPSNMTPAVRQAIERRAQNAQPMLNQTSQQQMMANPVPAPADPGQANKASAPNDQPPQETQKFQASNQEDLIVEALVEQLNNIQEGKKEAKDIGMSPEPPVPPQGGGGQYNQNMGGCGQKKDYGGGGLSSAYQSELYPNSMATSQKQGDYLSGMYSGINNYGQGS